MANVHTAGQIPAPSRAPRRVLAATTAQEVRELLRYRELVRYTVVSSLRSEHAGTALGFLWWVVDPLLLMGLYVVVIDIVLKRGGPDFAVFVLTAIITWRFFSSATLQSMKTTARKDRLMRSVAFPRSALPLAATLAEAVHLLFGFLVLLAIAIGFGIAPHPIDVLVVPIAAVELVFALGVAYLFTVLNVFFRDSAHVLNYVLRFWFFLSPTLYTIDRIPEAYRDVYQLNPFATLLPAYRSVVMDHRAPDFQALGLVALASIAVLAVGYAVFVRYQPRFAKVSA